MGERIGGRQKGTPNKRTLEVKARLEELGCDPIESLVRLAKDAEQRAARMREGMEHNPHADPNDEAKLAFQCYKELAGYFAPKLKAIEHSGQVDTAPVVNVILEGD